MTVKEKEAILGSAYGDFPSWRDLLELNKELRDQRLADMEDPESERPEIERDYEDALDRMIAKMK